ncbi:doublecortin domain-containing protein 2 isoform X18 [Magallana gigas]|uniref:doublecortin domain-containing protein 2 isoform X18 n=1 Tax=Magallana gigas TaxID=29159 RepID=UPI00333F693C
MKKTHPLPPIDRKREELPPDERELPHGKIIKMYKNGDKFRPAKPILFNESHFSSWEIFLDEVQEKLKFERPVRSIYTPEGGTEVYTFEQIQDDHAYVAASGKFEPFRYTAIESHSPRPSKINKSNFNSRIEPVVHSRIRQDARFRQSQTLASRAKRITVAINNDDIDHSHVVLIPAKKVNNLQAIIETIDDDLNNNRGIQFRVEYLVDTDTEEVCTHPEDIIEDHIYVACNKGRRYIPKTYSKDGRKNFVVIPSPRPLQRPKFIWERSNLNGSRDNKRPSEFYTLRTLPPIGSKNYKGSPDNSVTSNPEYGSRKKPHQANGAIHTKPQKHKRTPEKKAKQTDYDKDDGGVFKAKDTNKHTKGAREVGETKDTRTDLPIDQVPAEEVKEETLYEEENTAKVPSEITLTHKQSAEGEEDDEIYNHHDDHYDDDNDEDEKIKSQKTPKAPQNSNKDKNSKTSTKPDKKETTHKTNSKTNNNNTNNNNTNNKTNNNNNTNNKTNPKPADHSHGAKDPAPKKHSGTRGEFNNVSPLPGIGKNDTNRSSTPVGRNGFDSPTQQEKDLAAAKIQANYRGHKTRQELAKQKEGTKKNDAANKPPDTKKDAASKPPDTKKDAGKKPESKTKEDEAATKIQAGFRGHKTRQDLKKQKENQQDDKANAQQDQKQQNAPSAQSNNPAPSQSDQTAPKGNQTAPKADQTAPKADQTAPKGDQTAPKADQAAPKADQTAPKGDQTAPKGDQTAPKADQTAPKGDQTAPKTDQTAPKGDQTAPNADQTNPKGDQTAPKGDQTAPKGDQTAPKGDQTAPKGDNAAQKTDGTSQKGVKRPSTAGSSKPPSTAGP